MKNYQIINILKLNFIILKSTKRSEKHIFISILETCHLLMSKFKILKTTGIISKTQDLMI